MKVIAGRVAQQSVSALVGLTAGMLMARWLGPEGKGILAIVLLVSGVASQIATFGLHDAASFLGNHEHFPLARLRNVFDKCVVFWGMPLGGVIAVAMYKWSPALWLTAIPWKIALATAAIVAGRLGSLLYKGLLLADEDFGSVTALDFIDALVPGTLFVGGSLWWGPSVQLACGSFVVGAFLVAAGSRVLSMRVCDDQRSSPDSLLTALFSYGWQTYFRQIGIIVLARLDVFLVGYFLGVASVGIYSVAQTLAEVITRIPDAVSWMLLPRASRLTDAAARATTARYARFCLAAAAIVTIPYALVARILVFAALPPAFSTAAAALAVLLTGTIVSTVTKIVGADLVARGRAATVATITWITVMALGVDLWLIPRFGVLGAAVGSSLAQFIAAATMLIVYSHESGLNVRTLLLVGRDDLSLLRAALLSALGRRVQLDAAVAES